MRGTDLIARRRRFFGGALRRFFALFFSNALLMAPLLELFVSALIGTPPTCSREIAFCTIVFMAVHFRRDVPMFVKGRAATAFAGFALDEHRPPGTLAAKKAMAKCQCSSGRARVRSKCPSAPSFASRHRRTAICI